MPIVSRVIEVSTVQRDGSVRVREVLTDALGRRIGFHGAIYRDLAAANTAMNARDATDLLKDMDKNDMKLFTEAGNDPETFSLTDRDITIDEGLDALVAFFAEGIGSDVTPLSSWVVGLRTAKYDEIGARIGLDASARTRLKARAQDLVDVAPTYDKTERVSG